VHRLLTFSGAIALALLLAEACHAGEPVWCHEVRPGDTLTAIARRHGASVDELRGLNRLAPKAIPRSRSFLMLPTVDDLRRGRLDLSRPPLVARPLRLSARARQPPGPPAHARSRDSPALPRAFWDVRRGRGRTVAGPRLRVARPDGPVR
jgi:hypothetical protein